MKAYLDILRNIHENGERKGDRTGTGTKTLTGMLFEHDMQDGFPLLTTKKIPTKTMMVELEGFIKGITDKEWYQERGCHIWDEWANPQKAPYGHDEESKKRMLEERDLGPIYGFQWRHFGAEYEGPDADYTGIGVDQLADIVTRLKEKPDDRRMMVNAWNPADLDKMALPPCHYGFQVNVVDGKLNLGWTQRSIDTMLGLPFNIASYGTLLHLLAKETGLEEGKLSAYLFDTHIYDNHAEQVEEQLSREPGMLPQAITENFTSIFDWDHTKTRFDGYDPQPPIKAPIAV